ncbi:hypothetical protein A2U01_0105643, partial [Trifolium medium]|nr:hypothetical protein [Trifolium medium]
MAFLCSGIVKAWARCPWITEACSWVLEACCPLVPHGSSD